MNADSPAIHLFRSLVHSDMAIAVAAMNVLVSVIKESRASTLMELERELKAIIKSLMAAVPSICPDSSFAMNSVKYGCDPFLKYVTNSFIEDLSAAKAELLSRAETYANMSLSCRQKVAEIGHSFVQDGCTVLVHGNSRVVTGLLLKAAESKQFNVVVTDGRPQCDG
jgi:translation initiation factor 2B subunit (eIF-2B alpha/beta/delta family)